jgi:RimJ/RimL family protein N-acetyltransferase
MELVGKHVKLRAKTREDLPLYAQWLNNPALLALIQAGVPQPITLERLTVRFEQQLRADWVDAPTELGYVIADLQENRAIGCIGLQHIDWKNRCGSQLLFLVDRMILHSQGLAFGLYAFEALVLFLHFVFSELNLHRVEAETLAHNRSVTRGIEKVGFRREGVKRECVYRAGHYIDSYCYGLLKPEFYQSHHVQWVLRRLGLLQEPKSQFKEESYAPASSEVS